MPSSFLGTVLECTIFSGRRREKGFVGDKLGEKVGDRVRAREDREEGRGEGEEGLGKRQQWREGVYVCKRVRVLCN